MITGNTNIRRPASSSDFIKYRMGELDMIIISDGEVIYEDNCFAPEIPEIMLQEILNRHGSTPPHFNLAHNILVIKFKHHVIMMDTGNGHQEAPHAGKLLRNLALAEIAPEDITDIVLTHAHPDHVNGLTDDNNRLVFPAAKIHISQKEFEFWQNEADFSKSKNTVGSLVALQKEIQFFFSMVSDQQTFSI